MTWIAALALALQDQASIEWNKDADALFKSAAESHKPIFWLNLVGDLDGDA